MHRSKPNQNWKRIYLRQAFLTKQMYLRILVTQDNTFKMASIWPHDEKTLSQNAMCESQILTQHAKVQVERKSFAKSFRKFEVSLDSWSTVMQPLLFPIPKKIKGVAITFKHFYQKFFFLRAFQAPLKSKI